MSFTIDQGLIPLVAAELEREVRDTEMLRRMDLDLVKVSLLRDAQAVIQHLREEVMMLTAELDAAEGELDSLREELLRPRSSWGSWPTDE